MPGLRELKRHLKSVETVGQVAGAMRSASSAKYAKLSRLSKSFRVYADSCKNAASYYPAENLSSPDPEAPVLYVLMASNRGLSGGYNSDLFVFAEKRLEEGACIAVGKKAIAHCREKGIETAGEFVLPDIPEMADTDALWNALYDGYTEGKYSEVRFLYQRFRNVAVQIPTDTVFFGETDRSDITNEPADSIPPLILPSDAETAKKVRLMALRADFYGYILEVALGSQAAMMMAMRAAYDNAKESGEKLRIAISRERQARITASVIETASGNRKEN